jgi:hypothetical protein
MHLQGGGFNEKDFLQSQLNPILDVYLKETIGYRSAYSHFLSILS